MALQSGEQDIFESERRPSSRRVHKRKVNQLTFWCVTSELFYLKNVGTREAQNVLSTLKSCQILQLITKPTSSSRRYWYGWLPISLASSQHFTNATKVLNDVNRKEDECSKQYLNNERRRGLQMFRKSIIFIWNF